MFSESKTFSNLGGEVLESRALKILQLVEKSLFIYEMSHFKMNASGIESTFVILLVTY